MTEETIHAERTVPPVVVGVGPDEVQSALAYAAEEATRAGCGIHVVHAMQMIPTGADAALVSVVDLEKLGHETRISKSTFEKWKAGDVKDVRRALSTP